MQKSSTFVTALSVLVIIVAGVKFVWSMLGFDRESHDNIPLNRYMSIFEDRSAKMTVDQVMARNNLANFESKGLSTVNFGFTTSTIWIRIDLPHLSEEPTKQWFLEAGRGLLDQAELYKLMPDGRYASYTSDEAQRIDEYRLRYATATWVVNTKAGETVTYVICLRNRTAFFVPFTLWEPSAFVANITTTQILFGIFYGGMLIMLIYNLFVWFVVRDITYLWYFLHLLGATAFQFIDFGRGHELFGPYAALLDKRHIPFLIWWTWVFGMLFTERFLGLKERHPVLHQIIMTLVVISLVNGALSYAMPYEHAQLAAVAFSMVFLSYAPYVGFYSYYKGNKNALYFNVAWVCNISGYLVYSTVSTGISSANALTLTAMPLGTLLEVALLSFALGHRIKELENSTIRARRRSMANLTRFRSVFDNAIEGIYQMNLDGSISNANPSMVRQLGYSSERSIKKHSDDVRKILFPQPREQMMDLATQGRLVSEIEFTRPDGSTQEALHSVQLIRDRKGNPSHIEGTFVDITERRERDRADKERMLERREKELAKLATDAKSDFLKKMSYEIRMPLSSIKGYAETLRYVKLQPGEKQEVLDTLLVNSQALLGLINDVLDYSKIEAGKMPVEHVRTDLFILIEKVHSVVERQAVRRGLHFEVQHSFPLPREIHTDPTRLRQALENLSYHCINATQQGQVTLSVGWHNESQRLRFTLQDTSPGMSDEEQHKLFDVFSQNASGSRRLCGSGLGMVIARQLATIMGGQLDVSSRVRHGTTFDFYINCDPPARQHWVTSTTPTIASKPAKTKAAVPALVGHILVAEDNTVNQQLIQRVIRKTGAQVTIVPDGQRAVEEAQDQRFDLILMDVNMPVMGGLEATQTLRRGGYGGPIFALTAEQGADEIQACLVAGCDGHLGKPLELDKFYTILSQHLATADNDARQTGLQ